MFHGTNRTSANAIVATGFNISTQPERTHYGNGVYFYEGLPGRRMAEEYATRKFNAEGVVVSAAMKADERDEETLDLFDSDDLELFNVAHDHLSELANGSDIAPRYVIDYLRVENEHPCSAVCYPEAPVANRQLLEWPLPSEIRCIVVLNPKRLVNRKIV